MISPTLFNVILRRQCSGRLGLKTSNVTSNRLRLIFVIIHFANSRALHACHGSHVYSYGFLCLGKSKDSDPKHRNIRDMEGTSTYSTMSVECIVFYVDPKSVGSLNFLERNEFAFQLQMNIHLWQCLLKSSRNLLD